MIAEPLRDLVIPLDQLRMLEGNPRRGDVRAVARSLERFGQRKPVVARADGTVIAGNHMLAAARELGWSELAVTRVDDDDATAKAFALADNRTAELGSFDLGDLAAMVAEVEAADPDLLVAASYTAEDLEALLDGREPSMDGEAGAGDGRSVSLAERFVVPPFSVLDARQGYWQDRKRAWLGLGIESAVGRDARAYNKNAGTDPVSERVRALTPGDGGSIFDPVLCELAYRWFCTDGGSVLDPFAGGSVRGIVAAWLGHPYTGIDLSGRQVAANRTQAAAILPATASPRTDYTPPLTPIERHGEVWVKRDDLYSVAGAPGGKTRTCWALANRPGVAGLITAGARQSPQVAIVASIAARLGVPCRVHVPDGVATAEVDLAARRGATVVRHQAGRNSVIIARAREDAAAHPGWALIPFGMECGEAVAQTAQQVADLPDGIRRIIVPVGSGMTLAGVIDGMRRAGLGIPIVGVRVGADPTHRLDQFAAGWTEHATLVDATGSYEKPAPVTDLDGIALDPHYEAKCLPFLEPGDLLWCVGIRPSAVADPGEGRPAPDWIVGDSREILPGIPDESADLLFTCPPYYDLEVYEDPRDLSRAPDYEAFLDGYAKILHDAARCLRSNRFAVIVVGEVRDRAGIYHGLVPDTIGAMAAAGLRYYNEAVMVTPAGTLPVLAGNVFQASRKLGKGHQNVLVFYKGDPKAIKAEFGEVEVGEIPDPEISA